MGYYPILEGLGCYPILEGLGCYPFLKGLGCYPLLKVLGCYPFLSRVYMAAMASTILRISWTISGPPVTQQVAP